MITFFIGEGRLGNQIFQYMTVRTIFGKELLLTLNLISLRKVFVIEQDLKIFECPKFFEKFFRRLVVPLVAKPLFKWLRLGTYCFEPKVRMLNGSLENSGDICIRKGLFPIALFHGGYYQNLSDLLAPRAFQELILRKDVLMAARAVVDNAMGDKSWPAIVMHVRRGDYVGHRAYGIEDLLLPVEYFVRAAKVARKNSGAATDIFVVTDDPAWCKKELKVLEPLVVVSSSEAVDFALLSMFQTVIISNSTFSLAAALVGPTVQRIIAPKYWFGHSTEQWYPPKIQAQDNRFVYL